MNINQIKKLANEILAEQSEECSYIEYKKSATQLDKILKTICAFGNDYYQNEIQYIFLGVEEIDDGKNKAIPSLPICGINSGELENAKNEINKLRSFLYPNVSFEIIANEFQGRKYLLIAVPKQGGGPFMVSEKAEKDKRISLKPGRYVRIESDSRLARVDEEYDLLRKFANYHFSSSINDDAMLSDLDPDLINEYLSKTSKRDLVDELSLVEKAEMLHLLDKNDPTKKRVKNFAVLMFSSKPDNFIPYCYCEMIVDLFGNKRKMESKIFRGPIWKQYYNVVNYINDSFLNDIVIREDGVAENRRVSNFPFVAVEELVANAFVHNNYENEKAIQIYVSNSQINIVNYNKPLPPLNIDDLNSRSFFDERNTENPEIRDMFKTLGIIESFGTGIGEAKKEMKTNGSPNIFYKTFSVPSNVTSVVIPVNEEYIKIMSERKIGSIGTIGASISQGTYLKEETPIINSAKKNSSLRSTTEDNISLIVSSFNSKCFGNSDICKLIGCSKTSATRYIKKMAEKGLIEPVTGKGKGVVRLKNND